jgi:bacterioferritin (cytochrome b1)
MPQSNEMGMNRTGMDMAPQQGKEMLKGAEDFHAGPIRYDALERIRRSYIESGESLGTVPMPGTLRGAFSAGKEKFKGHNPEVLINKLGERLAFERAGVRLYDAIILKCESSVDEAASSVVSVELLKQFRNEEAEHFLMVKSAMESLGADTTAETPDADMMGVASMGISKVLTEPRTSISQCLEALQVAELADNAAWALLQDLCLGLGLQEMADDFEHAITQEERHAATIDTWLREITLMQGGVNGGGTGRAEKR